MLPPLSAFHSLWACDFEFQPRPGELPRPICMVARELKTGRTIRIWEDDLRAMRAAPISVGADSLFIAYYTPAEFSCFHALGWELPTFCLDLFVEFRNETNVHSQRNGASLISALVHYRQDALGFDEKESMRSLAIQGGPYSPEEKIALLDYCETDVVALQKLFPLMLPKIDVAQALLRGRYMKAVSVMERNGIPINSAALNVLQSHWTRVESRLIERIDKGFGVFEDKTFKRNRFEKYLNAKGYSWPRSESGALMLDEDSFHEMVRVYPQIAPIKELRHALSQLRLSGLTVGQDGRNRTSLSPFRATTGRNQPSNAQFIFGPSCWIRGLIEPPPGYALAYIDWCQQEFGIAAALSRDEKMLDAYSTGDPYLAFAKQAGAAPANGTKETHGPVRELFKQCVLAVQYGMGAESLAARIGQTPIQARYLLQLHHETYPKFWQWSDAVVGHAMLTSRLQTVFGWTLRVGSSANERSLRNFPMQANGSEMLRLACCLLVEEGIEVCGPVHDATIIVAPSVDIAAKVQTAKRLMAKASAELLGGFQLRTDEKIIAYPDHYMDKRGVEMWNTVWGLIDELKRGDVV